MAATGAAVVHVPLHAARDFHLDPADVGRGSPTARAC